MDTRKKVVLMFAAGLIPTFDLAVSTEAQAEGPAPATTFENFKGPDSGLTISAYACVDPSSSTGEIKVDTKKTSVKAKGNGPGGKAIKVEGEANETGGTWNVDGGGTIKITLEAGEKGGKKLCVEATGLSEDIFGKGINDPGPILEEKGKPRVKRTCVSCGEAK